MRKPNLLIAAVLSAAVALSAPGLAFAAEDTATKPDNTRMNKQENKEATAEQQSESKADREITKKIRRAVVKNKSLSLYAHNVKIITHDGMVTLKGPVRDEKEKKIVERAAAKVAGKEKVTSELEIAPEK